MFERVKKYYDLGLYNNKQVKQFVKKGFITSEQYEKITGEVYTP